MDIHQHQQSLRACRKCPHMIGPVITGTALYSRVMSVGQAPGIREAEFGRPFAWTAGKTLFKWFEQIGVTEESYRDKVYMAAVCRCFPGKNPRGGDRVPSRLEISNCKTWLQAEYALQQPELIIPIGKLAIQQYLDFNKLTAVIGRQHRIELQSREVDIIPLPHPSGVSTWFRTEPGKTLLTDSLQLISKHHAWLATFVE